MTDGLKQQRPALRSAWVLAFATLLASCGGGGSDSTSASAPTAAAPADAKDANDAAHARAQAFIPPIAVPADADTKGMWSGVYNWPLVSVHMVLLPDGRLMSFGSSTTGKQGASTVYDIWDGANAPDQGHLLIPNGTGTDIFCSSPLLVPPMAPADKPAVTISGGDIYNGSTTTNQPNNNNTVFDTTTNTLTRKGNMNRQRWYASSTALPNGEVYIQGGNGGADRPEVRKTDGTFRLLDQAFTTFDYYYPRNFVAPDGRVFGIDSNGAMYFVNPAGLGQVTNVGTLPTQYTSNNASVAMFRPGRLLQFGGNSNGAVVIDIGNGQQAPQITPTQSMSTQRRWVNATVLADGQVLATGGSELENQLTNVNNRAEIWNPQTGQWTLGSAGVNARMYHSTAILLPDASVMIGGGGVSFTNSSGPTNNLNVEIYYPPYLFKPGGVRAPRPSITQAPDWLDIGKTFAVNFANAASISRVTLVKTGSVTHSFNLEQRFIELTFQANGASALSVQAPAHAADAPPGYYHLFVFDATGVPSISKLVRVGVAANANPSTTPTVTNPGAQSGTVNSPASVAISANDPNGDVLSYAATGLPPGLTINASTGVISGSPTSAGAFDVVVNVSDGVNTASTSFVWTITGSNAVTINPLPNPTAVQSGNNVTFVASATGGTNVRFAWNFGDGSPDTAWSASGSASHNFATAGNFSITVKVTDDSNVVQSRTFLQTVYLPATAGKPTASTNLVLEKPASGNARLWVVNQDNDSITGFDAVSRAKLGEVTVGASPRSIAVGKDGNLWVANKRSATISIVNPATRTLTGTLTLTRASQPFGIVMSPDGATAYVALEATAQVVRIDVVSRSITATVNVGTVGHGPRNLSVSADGAQVYAPLFVTPALPGEGTANVDTSAGNGAKVVVLNGANLATNQVVTLAHSDVADTEISGGGLPNYLGAAVISPDGTQAYVPSKQDNIKRGMLRNNQPLNFQNTVRAVSSRIVLSNNTEDLTRRIDHDNASLASAAVFDPTGVYLFVALETSREVAVVGAHDGQQLMRFDVGRAPQGLAISDDGNTLYVNNFMDRTVGVFDLTPLLRQGQSQVVPIANLTAVAIEKLTANVLVGKQFFYDARDTRLSRDRYMSCATCHSDGGYDGRTWDFTGQGEGLRNTPNLRGRAGSQGKLHWSANFDEVQDFEGQIRTLAGGTGLMTDAAFNTGTRSQPLGDPKAGVSADLDALAAYVSSLDTFDLTPYRDASGALTNAASAGKALFLSKSCSSCHGGATFTNSASLGLANVGTVKASSGQRLGGPLTGIDIPTLRDVWSSAPYLHDGSAASVEDAIAAHNNVSTTDTERAQLAEFVRELGSEEGPINGNGSITGSAVTSTALVDLTAEGTLDWAHWGQNAVPGLIRKANVTAQISDFTLLNGGAAAFYTNDLRPLKWSDGTPTATMASTTTGLYAGGINNGFAVTVPADLTTRTVKVYVGGYASQATFRATLSDGSSPDYVDAAPGSGSGQYVRNYTITYRAASVGQTLRLSWMQTAGSFGNVTLNAVTLVGSAVANRPPVLIAPAPQTGTQSVATSLALSATDPDNDPLVYAASGLPPGLTINPNSGAISGTPTTIGSYNVGVAVADTSGATSQQSFSWTILAPNRAPMVTAPDPQSSTTGTPVNLPVVASDPDGETIAFAATGLPPSLSINALNGIISGTPTTPGNFAPVIAVGDARGASTTATFTWVVTGIGSTNHAPVVTAPAAQTTTTGTAVSLAVAAMDVDGDALVYSATGLPTGLAISPSSGVITGTPTVADTYSPTVTVDDGKGGTGTASFAWTVTAPSATGSLTATADAATTTIDIAAAGTLDWVVWGQGNAVPGVVRKANVTAVIPSFTAIGAGGLNAYNNDPRGITYSGGTPTAAATAQKNGVWTPGVGNGFSVVLPADTTTRTAKIMVGGWNSGGTLRATLSDGSAADYLDTTPTVTNFSQFDRTYTLSYKAAAAGQTLTVTWVMAAGSGGNVTLNGVALATSAANRPPVVTTPAAQSGVRGTATSLAIIATDPDGDTLAYAATGLPTGMTISATTGMISGTPSVAGSYTPVVTVTDGRGGSTQASFAWTVQAPVNHLPTITAPGNQTTAQNAVVNVLFAGADQDGDTLTWSATGLPTGLSMGATTGRVTGTATALGTYNTTLVVNDGNGGTANASFTWTVTAAVNNPPLITTPATQTTVRNGAVSLAVSASDADGDALTYSAPTLPPGLSINAASGVITGTATVAGTYAASVSVADGRGGSATANFTWNVVEPSGNLTGGATSATTTVNLTTLGTADWIHWGENAVPGLVRKTGGTQLSTYAVVGSGTVSYYTNDPRGVTWTNGTPTASGTAKKTGVWIGGIGNGFTFTAPADTTTRTVTVLVGGWNSGGTFKAELSDGSSPAYTDVTPTIANFAQFDRTYTVTYKASSAGQTLRLTWTQSSGAGNVTINAATLSP